MGFLEDCGNGMARIGNSIAKETDRAMRELGDNVSKDAAKIDTAIQKGGLLGGVVEAADVFSPGHQSVNVLDAFNVIPEDVALQEGISAGINIGMGLFSANPLTLAYYAVGAKDIGEAMAAGSTPMAPAHSTASPSEELVSRTVGHGAHEGGRVDHGRKTNGQDAIERHRREQAIDLAKDKIRARRDGYAAGYDAGFKMGYESGYLAAIKRNEELFGDDKTGQVESEIDKILSNPNLCFEDMIFALLRAVIKEGQGDVKEMAKDLKNGRLEEGEIKKDFDGKIKAKTEEIKNEKDPARKNDLQNELQNLREERAEKLSERSESRAEVAEDLKNLMAKLSEMQQALSNILNTQHEGAMSAIRNIK